MADIFDYVIVGAGSAGCLLANRLTEDAGVTVCVLEAGGGDRHPWLSIPAGFVKTLYGDRFVWPFKTEPSAAIGGRQISIPQGKVVGGSSAINGLVYNRGRRADFDGWAERGNKGWSYRELLPYFMRSETRIGTYDARFRGRSGELPITDTDWRHPLCDAFLAAAEGMGIARNPDYNGESTDGAGYYQRFIQNGKRISAARAFLRPALARGRTDLRTRVHVAALTFEGRKATGVRYRDSAGTERIVQARREVLVCAGAVNTPKLLQLSGIGPGALLNGLGIPVRHALEGVGENLRDHFAVRLVARAKNLLTINEYARWPRLGLQVMNWLAGKPSILALSPTLVYANLNSDRRGGASDIKIIFTPASYKEGKLYVLDDFPGMTCGASQQRPQSAGYVRIRSRDPADAPTVQPNYLAAETDQRLVVAGLKLARALLRRPELAPYFDRETLPGPSVASDDEFLDFARRRGNTGYHLVGTCRMGPADDRLAVVDDQLRVRGIDGLRVVDASIMPMIPSANTYAATLAIAEKAADMIRGRAPLAPADLNEEVAA